MCHKFKKNMYFSEPNAYIKTVINEMAADEGVVNMSQLYNSE